MSDFKSKIPDFHEMATFTGKLLKDIKKSIGEIMVDYKNKRAEEAANESKEDKKEGAAKVEVETTIVEATSVEPVKEVKKKVEEVIEVKLKDQEPKS